MSMREGETLKNYSDRYWEIYNEIDGNFENVAVRTFKVGLPTHSNLWKPLTIKSPRGMHQLMDWIEEHKRVKNNQNQSKGKAKVFTLDRRDNQANRYTPSHLRREFFYQENRNPIGPCKVEFIQPSNWLYSVPNLLVIQHLVTLYLGGFDVRVVSEIE